MKVIVDILGPGASGKSTLSRNILEDPCIIEVSTTVQALDQHRGMTMAEKVKYTLSGNGIALAGNWKNGSDSIKSMDALAQVIELCWKKRDTVIVDPIRCSNKFVDWMKAYPEPLSVLFIYLDMSVEENIRRLLARRHGNVLNKGKESTEEELPEKTYENMIAFRDRAKGVWKHACTTYDRLPNKCLVLHERFSAAESAKAVHIALEQLRSEGGLCNGEKPTEVKQAA
jgi:adenylate kinase family enzyme